MDLSEVLAAYVRGDGMDPGLLLALLERLPDSSMTAALMSGGKQMFGWSQERYMLADLYDAINLNTAATGNFKKKPDIKPYPRPKSKLTQQRKTGASKAKGQFSLKKLHAQFASAAAKQNG